MDGKNDNDLGQIDANAVLRDLMDVAKVAIGPGMPQLGEAEALSLLNQLLRIAIERMPEDLQRQDRRIAAAKVIRDLQSER